MKKELNLQCLYSVTLDLESLIYSFITKNQIEYKIAFADSLYLFDGTSTQNDISKVYSLIVDNVSTKFAPLDSEVQITIDCIISHFFEDKENSIIYLCDGSDNRELARNKKFNSWYQKSDFKDAIIKIDEQIPVKEEHTIHYTSLLYHKENPFYTSLENSFYEVVESLKKDK